MFIHIEYSLQTKIHQYYNEVQDTLQIEKKAIYILRPSGLQELSTSRSSRPAKKGHTSWIPRGLAIKPEGGENPANLTWPQKWLATLEAQESQPDQPPTSQVTRDRPSPLRASEAASHF